jgi:2-methylfumaryl-CoA hydratase
LTTRTNVTAPQYGRLIDDFRVGETYDHPWEVTIDDGLLAMFAASFLDPNPLYSSTPYSRSLGFRSRLVHPLVLLNLTIGYSVNDVSEQAIAHLAYIDVRFPNACYAGDTLRASSTVLDVRITRSNPDRGIVHIRTVGFNQDDKPVITFERKALIPSGSLARRAHPTGRVSSSTTPALAVTNSDTPPELEGDFKFPEQRGGLRGSFEDFEIDEVILHENGRTIGESEHMQLTLLSRNSHPLHFDEVYSRERSIAKTRLVCGPLVFAWVASLASRDTAAKALWPLNFDDGRHPAPVLAGETLYAASCVLDKESLSESMGKVRFKLIGIKNTPARVLLDQGIDPFNDKFDSKVLEIERTVLLPKRR